MANKTIITAAVTGAWPKKENNPNVPLTPAEISEDVYQCWQAGAAIEPGLAQRMQKSLAEAAEKQELDGEPAILLTSGVLRTTLSRFVKNSIPGLRVLSYQEIPEEKQIKIVSSVGQQRQTGMIK